MKVFITGAHGFIGSVLCEQCVKEGIEVVTLEKDLFEINSHDLEGVDCIFHLAGITNILETIQKPFESTKVNVLGTVHILDTMVAAHVPKIVFASTASVYGRNPIPWIEEVSVDPIEQYSFQKISCEAALKAWSVRHGVHTVSLRLFQVFGKKYRADSVFSNFIAQKEVGEPLTVVGVRHDDRYEYTTRDFVYVDDVAEAFIKSAYSKTVGNGEIINIGSGRSTSLYEIAQVFEHSHVVIPLRPFEVLHHQADITKAANLLQWKPKTEVLSWLAENIHDM